MKTYDKLKAAGKNFEVIFVSSDRDEESWKEYLSSMPWFSLPHGDSRKKALSRKFEVSGEHMEEGGEGRKREREGVKERGNEGGGGREWGKGRREGMRRGKRRGQEEGEREMCVCEGRECIYIRFISQVFPHWSF